MSSLPFALVQLEKMWDASPPSDVLQLAFRYVRGGTYPPEIMLLVWSIINVHTCLNFAQSYVLELIYLLLL